MFQIVYDLGKTLGGDKKPTPRQKQVTARLLGELREATARTVEALRAWHQTTAPDATHARIKNTRDNTEQFTDAITEYLGTLGIEAPARP